MAEWRDDYTRSRTVGLVPYDINDIDGREDKVDKSVTSTMTVSGTVDLLPLDPLGRRDHIRVENIGGVDVAVLSSATMSGSDGIIVEATSGVWEDNTDAILYIVSTGADSEVRVYERSTR